MMIDDAALMKIADLLDEVGLKIRLDYPFECGTLEGLAFALRVRTPEPNRTRERYKMYNGVTVLMKYVPDVHGGDFEATCREHPLHSCISPTAEEAYHGLCMILDELVK